MLPGSEAEHCDGGGKHYTTVLLQQQEAKQPGHHIYLK